MELIHAIFWLFALVTCGSALIVALTPRLIHAVFGLFFCFFGTAGLYVLLGADFLAATQVIIYIGGVLVLMIFGVMLTNRQTNEGQLPNEITHGVVAALLCLMTFSVIIGFPRHWKEVDGRWARTFDDAAVREPVGGHGHAHGAAAAPTGNPDALAGDASVTPARDPKDPKAAATTTSTTSTAVVATTPARPALTERVPLVKNTTRQIGETLLTTYLIPFELASLVLLVAMLGAASIARKEIR
jgi:NADH:ubiquinone oxidoreductase subunit 6 (subunit J)